VTVSGRTLASAEVAALAAGTSASVRVACPPGAAAISGTFAATADSGRVVHESDEANNRASGSASC